MKKYMVTLSENERQEGLWTFMKTLSYSPSFFLVCGMVLQFA